MNAGLSSQSIATLGRRSFVSQRGLEELLTWARNHKDILGDIGVSRGSLKRAREKSIQDCCGPYGPIIKEFTLKTAESREVKVSYLCPAASLHNAALCCPGFSPLLQECLTRTPPTILRPWRLVVYTDEVSPGNQLKAQNSRKLWAIYWSVQELGSRALTKEESWFVLTLLRSDAVSQLQDTVSQLMKAALGTFFEHSANFSMGVPLTFLDGSSKVLVATIGYLLGDESALKHTYENKGSAGKMLCLFCNTTVNRRYAPAVLGRLVLHTDLDTSKFCLHTDASVWQYVDALQAKRPSMNKKEFNDYQSNIGFNLAPAGVLRDLRLREHLQPISATCFDPMHIYFVNGLFHLEVTLLLSVLNAAGIKRERIHAFLQDWDWPAAVRDRGATGKKLFAKKTDGDWKSSASEALALYPVLRVFCSQLPRSAMTMAAVNSFLALCQVLDDIRLASAGAIGATVLLEHIRAHLKAFQLAHGLDRFLPKAHYSLHLPDQLLKHGVLLQCFTHERRHKELKRYANNYCTGIDTVERSLLGEVFLTHVLDLREFSMGSSLEKWNTAGPELVGIFVRHFQTLLQSELLFSAYVDRVKVGDVVVCKEPEGLGEVICNYKYENQKFSLISFFEKRDAPNTFLVRSNLHMVMSTDIRGPCIFKRSGDICEIAPESFLPRD